MPKKITGKKNKKNGTKLKNEPMQVLYDREHTLVLKNYNAVEEYWNGIHHDLLDENLKNDFTVLKDALNYYLQAKSRHLEFELNQIDGAQNERKKLFSVHVEGLDRLSDLFEQRLKCCMDIFGDSSTALMHTFTVEKDENENRKRIEFDHLSGISEMLNETSKADRDNFNRGMKSVFKDAYYQYLIQFEAIQLKVEKAIEDLLFKLQAILTIRISKEYKILQSRDEGYQAVVFEQFRRIKILKNDVRLLKCKLNDKSADTNAPLQNWLQLDITETRKRKMETQNLYFGMQNQLQKYMDMDQVRLLTLTLAANDSCKGMEKLQAFWEDLGGTQIECKGIAKEISRLEEENRQLKSALSKFFSSYR